MSNFTNFTKIITVNESTRLISNDIMTVDEIKNYLDKVNKKIPKTVADIIYLTAKYELTTQNSIDDIRDANKSKLDKLAFKYNIPQSEMEDLWKSLKDLKTNLRLLPQYQTSSERNAFINGNLLMSDITIDVETSAGRNACAKQYMPLVHKIVNSFVGKCPLNKPELMSAGMMGFTYAMNTWRKHTKNNSNSEDINNKSVPFKTYAGYCVRNQILQDINNLGYVVKTNQHAIWKNGSSAFQGKSLDGFGINNDDEFKQDRLAVLGIEDANQDLISKNEDELFLELYKFIEGKFKQRDIDIFYRYFGLNGYQKEKGKDIAKSLGLSQSYVTMTVKYILNYLKKDKTAMDILTDLQSVYNESLMVDLLNFDKSSIVEAILSDDTFILLEELTKWSNKDVYINTLEDVLKSLENNERKEIEKILKGEFDYLDKVFKHNKKIIIKFLSLMYPTDVFIKKSDVTLLEYMDELAELYKKHI